MPGILNGILPRIVPVRIVRARRRREARGTAEHGQGDLAQGIAHGAGDFVVGGLAEALPQIIQCGGQFGQMVSQGGGHDPSLGPS